MKVIKVLSYVPGTMKVVAKEDKTISLGSTEIVDIPMILDDVEEPTAAMYVALTDGLIARGDKERAAKAARMAITQAKGDHAIVLTLFTMLYKADMVELAKTAVATMNAPLAEIDAFVGEGKVSGLRNYFDLNKRAEKGRAVEKQ